jgi:multiple antibiotic resistance protein
MSNVSVPLSTLGPLLFMTMGPVSLIPIFAAAAAGSEPDVRRRIAARAVLVAFAALMVAVLVGAGMLQAWGAPTSSLIIAAGFVLTLTSLRAVLGTTTDGGPQTTTRGPLPESFAVSPLAFPSIVSPHGIGILIIFVAYFPEPMDKAAVIGLGLLVLAIDYVALLAAPRIMTIVGMLPFLLLGSVFGILQVALGVNMILSGLKQWQPL